MLSSSAQELLLGLHPRELPQARRCQREWGVRSGRFFFFPVFLLFVLFFVFFGIVIVLYYTVILCFFVFVGSRCYFLLLQSCYNGDLVLVAAQGTPSLRAGRFYAQAALGRLGLLGRSDRFETSLNLVLFFW